MRSILSTVIVLSCLGIGSGCSVCDSFYPTGPTPESDSGRAGSVLDGSIAPYEATQQPPTHSEGSSTR